MPLPLCAEQHWALFLATASPCPLLQSPAKLKRKRDEQKENMPNKSSKKTIAAPADPGKPHKKEAEMPDSARVQGLMEIGVIRLPVKVSTC